MRWEWSIISQMFLHPRKPFSYRWHYWPDWRRRWLIVRLEMGLPGWDVMQCVGAGMVVRAELPGSDVRIATPSFRTHTRRC